MGTLFKEYIIEKIIEYLEKPKKNIYFAPSTVVEECSVCNSIIYCSEQECPWEPCLECNEFICSECEKNSTHSKCKKTRDILCATCSRKPINSHYIDAHPDLCIFECCSDIASAYPPMYENIQV